MGKKLCSTRISPKGGIWWWRIRWRTHPPPEPTAPPPPNPGFIEVKSFPVVTHLVYHASWSLCGIYILCVAIVLLERHSINICTTQIFWFQVDSFLLNPRLPNILLYINGIIRWWQNSDDFNLNAVREKRFAWGQGWTISHNSYILESHLVVYNKALSE